MSSKLTQRWSQLSEKGKYTVQKLMDLLTSDEQNPKMLKAVQKTMRRSNPSKHDGRKQPNSYMVFKHEIAPMLKKEHPDMKAMDIGRLVGKKRNERTPEEKQEYLNKAKKQKIEKLPGVIQL